MKLSKVHIIILTAVFTVSLLFQGCYRVENILDDSQGVESFISRNGLPMVTCISVENKKDFLSLVDVDYPSGISSFPYLTADVEGSFFMIYPQSKDGVSGIKHAYLSYFSEAGNNWDIFMDQQEFRLVEFDEKGQLVSDKIESYKGVVIFPNVATKEQYDKLSAERNVIFKVNTTKEKKGDWVRSDENVHP